jgi:uncharacterized spore protein YtfJ
MEYFCCCGSMEVTPTEGAVMQVQDVIAQARDALTVKRVFGEPYERDGVTIIPAARVGGGAGAGGGEGTQAEGTGSGSGAGFGMRARPVGAFVVRGGELSWHPAVDVTRIVLGGQLVAIVALLTVRAIVRARARRAS